MPGVGGEGGQSIEISCARAAAVDAASGSNFSTSGARSVGVRSGGDEFLGVIIMHDGVALKLGLERLNSLIGEKLEPYLAEQRDIYEKIVEHNRKAKVREDILVLLSARSLWCQPFGNRIQEEAANCPVRRLLSFWNLLNFALARHSGLCRCLV